MTVEGQVLETPLRLLVVLSVPVLTVDEPEQPLTRAETRKSSPAVEGRFVQSLGT